MSRPTGRHRGLAPLIVALGGTVTTVVWLTVFRPQGSPMPIGYLSGPVAMAAAAYASWLIGRQIRISRPVRGFWRRVSQGSVAMALAAAVSVPVSGDEPGVSPYVAAPMLVGVVLTLLGFLHLPVGRRTAGDWLRLLLDGAVTAVAGALIFTMIIADLAPPGVPDGQRIGAAALGVAGLVAAVVIGRTSLDSSGPLDSLSLRLLCAAPLTGVVAAPVLIAGRDGSRTAMLVLTIPVVSVIICAGAYRQLYAQTAPPEQQPTPARQTRSVFSVLPFLAVATAAGLVVLTAARDMVWEEQAVVVGTIVIAVLVVLRQLLGLRENRVQLSGIRRQREELEHLAMHDPLTGLANRSRFGTVLAERLDKHLPATVLLIDIDDFKMVNDSMGHAVGDRLLHEVAQRLRRHSAVTELPSRLGGDEFAVLLEHDDPAYAEDAATRILASLAVPFRVDEHQLLANASVGVALAGQGDSGDEVLRNADIAMYAAKAGGKGSWARFEPRMRHEVVNHARLGSELHNAIIRHELFLLYQPVFDMATGRISGAEALVRWQHPTRGFVSPGDFIPVAEKSGLIVPLGAWVLQTACAQLAAWKAEYGEGAVPRINVNVAARQLRDATFVDEVGRALSANGLLPHELVLEVTESSVVEGHQVRETLAALHDLGVRLALDDFGTGQSSLSLLRAFPVDVLKLDKSFVDGICEGNDRGRLAVAAAVAQLAEYLELTSVAEGIESADQMARLKDMGYRYGQGFHLARPLPAAEVGALMAPTSVPVDV